MPRTPYSVGEEVRVTQLANHLNQAPSRSKENTALARCGVVAFINDDEDTLDIMYGQRGEEEEANVPVDRVRKLEPFESEYDRAMQSHCEMLDPFDLKDKGNVIFGLQDAETASRYYTAALRCLHCLLAVGEAAAASSLLLSDGSDVLVKSSGSQLRYLPATVICMDDGSSDTNVRYEVEYDDADCSEPAIRAASDLTPLAAAINSGSSSGSDKNRNSGDSNSGREARRQLQRSLYLNLARCHMKRSQPGWTIHYCSLALGVTESLRLLLLQQQQQSSAASTTGNTLNKYFADAYFIRAKAFLMASRPDFAKKVSVRKINTIVSY